MVKSTDAPRPRRRQPKKRRIGIFGGTFSPIHYGHLICAEQMRYAFQLDQVEFAVSANPPHKTFGVLDDDARYEMTVAATEDHRFFNASRVDLDHGANGYSLHTVQAIKRQYKGAELFYLSSAEYLDPFHKWTLKSWIGGKELFKICTMIFFPRNTQELDQLHEWAKLVPEARILIADAPSPPISSTLIRDYVMAGRSIWYTTPWPVQQIIQKKGYYRHPESPMPARDPVPRDKIKRVAIYASQFDPIHYSHLLFAESVRQEEHCDRVVFIPLANPEYREEVAGSAEARYKMCVVATADNPFFEVSRADINRHVTSYALSNVEDMEREFPGAELDYIISSDYVDPDHPLYLPTWFGAEELFKRVRFILRPTNMEEIEGIARIEALAAKIKSANIKVSYAPQLPISEAGLRDMVRRGQPLQFCTPYAVQQSIAKHGLYR